MADHRRRATISVVAVVLTIALTAGTAEAIPASPDSTGAQSVLSPPAGRAPETLERVSPGRVPAVPGQVLGPATTPVGLPVAERVAPTGATPPIETTPPVAATVPVEVAPPVEAPEPTEVTAPVEGAPPGEAPAPVDIAPPAETTASDDPAPPVAESAVQGVSGTVTETGSGAPVPGVFLAVLRSSDYTVAGGAVADGSGNYSAPVGAGSYYVYAIDPTGGHTSGFFGAPTLVTVTPGATADADPTMAPTRGSITATVTETGTGTPIGGVWGLSLSASAANPGATELAVVADGTGQLTLPGLTQTNHYVGFVDPAGGHQTRFFPNSPDVPGATPVAVTAGAATAANASLPAQTLVGTGAAITGTVTEQGTDDPLTNARVFALRAADYQIVRAATTNTSGHYTLDLTPGAYKLAFLDADGRHHLEWYDNQPAAGLASAVSVTAPGTADAALNPSTATMAGTVTDETSGDPIAHAWVIAIGDQGVAGGTTTAADGTYTISGLPPGTYRAAFIDPTGGRTMEYYDGAPSFPGATPIALTTATATVDATLGYPPPGAHCGPVTTHETWGPGVHQITCPVQIEAGGSVVLAAGAAVQTQSSAYLEVRGSLVVAGTAEAPVTVSGVSLTASWGGSLSVTHAIVSNANVTAESPSAPVVVTDSVFSGSRYGAVAVSSSAQPVSILRNTILNSTGVGISVSATGSATVDVADNQVTNVSSTGSYGPYKGRGVYVLADPAGGAITPRVEGNSVTGAAAEAVMVVANRLAASSLEDNTGSGNGQNVLGLAGHLVEDLTYPRPGLDVGVISANEQSRTLIVDDGVTFTLNQGSTLTGLARDWCFNCSDEGKPYVVVNGSNRALVVAGTAEAPVRISGVSLSVSWGGSLSVTHAIVSNANVTAESPSAPVVVTDSVFSGSRYGAVAVSSSAQPVSILRNTILNSTGVGISVSATGSATVDVADNQVTNVSSTGSYGPYKGRGVYVLADPEGGAITPRVEGNSVTGAAAEAVMVVANQLAASSLEDNTGSGNGQNVLGLAGHLVEDLTYPRPGLDVGVISANQRSQSLIVDDGVTFTLNQGSTLTGLTQDWCFYCSDLGKPYVEVNGRLQATATPSDPVRIRYVNIAANTGSEISLDQVDIKYASTALWVADGARATVHGSITDSTIGISASTWVDATNVNWGDPSGPSPIGSGTSISGGGVFVVPWVGYQVPQLPPAGPPAAPPSDSTCRDFMFIGARGSGEPPQGDPPYYNGDGDALGDRTNGAYVGFQERMHQLHPDQTIQPYGLRYRALGILFNPINFGVDDYIYSIYGGVSSLVSLIENTHSRCGSQTRFILSGFSQGALVVNRALAYLETNQPSLLSSSVIAGVILIADPAKISGGQETLWEAANTAARPSVSQAEGIWTLLRHAPGFTEWGPLPSAVTDRTIAICHDNDIVCAPGFGSSGTAHGNYNQQELGSLGTWMANHIG